MPPEITKDLGVSYAELPHVTGKAKSKSKERVKVEKKQGEKEEKRRERTRKEELDTQSSRLQQYPRPSAAFLSK